MALADALGTNTMGGLPVSQRASVIPGGKFDSVQNYQTDSDLEPLMRQSREGAEAARALPGIESKQKEAIVTKQLSGEQKAFEDYRKAVQEASSTEDLNKIIERRNREFVPTQETAGDIANIFTITNLLGFALGGLGKGHAQQAMSAMNGMLEGHLQGREDEYKKQKTIYEENQKALDKLVTTLQEKKKEAMELAKTDYDGALVNLKQEMHAAGMPFVAEIADKQGLVALGNYADKMIDKVEKLRKLNQDHQDKVEARKAREKQAEDSLALRREIYEGRQAGSKLDSNEISALADDVGTYSMDIKQVPAKIRAKVLETVASKYPGWSQQVYGDRDKAYQQYANPNGTGAKQIQSLSVVAQHIDALEHFGEALNNSRNPMYNQARNWFATQLGHPEVTNFDTAKQVVAQEILKAVGGGGVQARADRAEAEQALNAAKSPAQLKGAINTIKKLIEARLDVVGKAYESSTGRKDFYTNMIDSNVVDTLKNKAAEEKIPTITTKSEYDALPKGAYFIEDGKRYRKP
jgi:hypothetical protein